MDQDAKRGAEVNEQKKWNRLVTQLTPGMNADESEFVEFDPEQLIAEARSEKATDKAVERNRLPVLTRCSMKARTISSEAEARPRQAIHHL